MIIETLEGPFSVVLTPILKEKGNFYSMLEIYKIDMASFYKAANSTIANVSIVTIVANV